jgi:uncharacterized protein (TIGR02246 family)
MTAGKMTTKSNFAQQEKTMVRSYLKTILAVFILVSVATAVSWAKTDTKAANEAAIKKLVASWDECFERKDAHACAMFYVEDGDFTSVRGDSDHGRLAVEEHYKKVFTTFLLNAHRKDTVRSIRFLSPTIASVDSDFEITGATAPNANEAAKSVRKGLLTWIVTKQNGQWYIAVFHELDLPGK